MYKEIAANENECDDAAEKLAALDNDRTDWQIWTGDCRDRLSEIPDQSVHLVVTDPPYFLDGLDNGWSKGRPESPRATGTVGGLPVGMKFDPLQGIALQEFLRPVFFELYRVLKPGGFLVSFSQPRLHHRMAVAAEDAKFEIRDMIAWHFTKKAQFKAFSLNHFIPKMNLSATEQKRLSRDTFGRKTPQLRPNFEAMILAQRPREGTFLENWRKHRVGLMDASQRPGRGAPSNVMHFEKEPAEHIDHLTVKPVALIQHIIELFSAPGQTVLDPFVGSGTTCVSAKLCDRKAIGIEINPRFASIARKRLSEI